MQAYTDYPFVGDQPGEQAPIREITVLWWDGDKYATIEIDGMRIDVKVGYLYTQPGRCGNVPTIDTAGLEIVA